MDKYEALKKYLLERKAFFDMIVGNLEANGVSDEKYEVLDGEYSDIEKYINEMEGVPPHKC